MKKMLISGFVAVILTSAASAAFAQYIYIEWLWTTPGLRLRTSSWSWLWPSFSSPVLSWLR